MSQKIIIGISGEQGSFSEEAANHYCHQNRIKNYELSYLVDMEGVLKHLKKKKIDRGIFPLVNSRGGVVEQAVIAMGRYNFKLKDIFKILIRHCLLAKKSVSKKEIQKVVSHPQALKQCQKYLKKLKKVQILPYSDTALAACDLARGSLEPRSAVIAPKTCAKIYGLEILESDIQDVKDNFTSFLVVSR